MDVGKLESFIVEKMAERRVPGISISIIKDGDVVYAKGFGYRNVEARLPSTPETIYGIGSITKSFTALAIMKLVEEGGLSLDDPVEKYVDIKLRPFGEPVTVHHLLTHSSGIPSLGYAEAFIDGMVGGDNWLPVSTPEETIAFARDMEKWAVAKPGERFFYLNTGYVLLGKIIEKVSGVPYEEYIKKKILEPLGMKRSYFFKEEVEKEKDVAMGYILDKEGRLVPQPFPYGITADGGLLSSVLDLAKYLKMYIERDETIVSKEYIEKMETLYIKVPWEIFGGEGYGYGLIIYPNFLGEKLVGHSGSVGMYTGYVGYISEKKIGVAVLENSSGYPPSHIAMYALALLLGKDPEKELPFIYRERILKKLEGRYMGYKGTIKFEVKVEGDIVYLRALGRAFTYTIPLFPEVLEEDFVKCYTLSNGRKMYAEFYIRDGKVDLIFERYKLVKY
ncbi:beta-lactamase-like protein [Pyrococcus sp. NA2]|uniref:serine hydrolase n=1 Tax=Pyrococcus sp. (strain NA2) TaxID=342949 RepID=UPI000209AD2D|nr:serine hydrolase [Pyrococcus sp. NA2]AEC51585.1 beta-lactamase-like protein [Pyrococcus sp. NA2]